MAVIRTWDLPRQPWIAPVALATKVVRTIASQMQLLMDRAQETNSETVEMPWVHRERNFDEIVAWRGHRITMRQVGVVDVAGLIRE